MGENKLDCVCVWSVCVMGEKPMSKKIAQIDFPITIPPLLFCVFVKAFSSSLMWIHNRRWFFIFCERVWQVGGSLTTCKHSDNYYLWAFSRPVFQRQKQRSLNKRWLILKLKSTSWLFFMQNTEFVDPTTSDIWQQLLNNFFSSKFTWQSRLV